MEPKYRSGHENITQICKYFTIREASNSNKVNPEKNFERVILDWRREV